MSQDHERRIRELERKAGANSDSDAVAGCGLMLVLVLIAVDAFFGAYVLEAVLSPWLGPMPR